MIKRIVDISEQAYVRLGQKQMLIERDAEVIGRIPVEDIGMVILQHPAIVITQAVVVACQQQGAAIIFCDERHLPYSITFPMSEGHTLHSKVLREQIAVSQPTKKRLWQQVVKQKIAQQSDTLHALGIDHQPLSRLCKHVKSGDSGNHEAQAAQKYWALLMGKEFRRDREAEGINALLNYGYAIMRAMVARAIVGSGLHPSLGLHHHNQYDGLCLADDLMEPFRPWVDRMAYRIAEEQEQPAVDRDNKAAMLGLLSRTVEWEKRRMPLMVACQYLMASLKQAFTDRRVKLTYPGLVEESS